MMADLLLTQEPLIRCTAFFGVLKAMALWQRIAPSHRFSVSKPLRWWSNLGTKKVYNALRMALSIQKEHNSVKVLFWLETDQ